jgi:hypothetical protein
MRTKLKRGKCREKNEKIRKSENGRQEKGRRNSINNKNRRNKTGK